MFQGLLERLIYKSIFASGFVFLIIASYWHDPKHKPSIKEIILTALVAIIAIAGSEFTR